LQTATIIQSAAAAAAAAAANIPASSKLCEKNKMLASLLAKTPVIPSHSLSTSIASPKPSALPQEKLPKDLKVSQWRRHFFIFLFSCDRFRRSFSASSFSFFSLPSLLRTLSRPPPSLLPSPPFTLKKKKKNR
jgi:hypothetical protein